MERWDRGLTVECRQTILCQTVGTEHGSSMREKGIRTLERVLSGAKEVFHRGGVSGTSINDLIRETGVKKGNLYHIFPSKEEMGLEVLRQAREDFSDSSKSPSRETGRRSSLRTISTRFFGTTKGGTSSGGASSGTRPSR